MQPFQVFIEVPIGEGKNEKKGEKAKRYNDSNEKRHGSEIIAHRVDSKQGNQKYVEETCDIVL